MICVNLTIFLPVFIECANWCSIIRLKLEFLIKDKPIESEKMYRMSNLFRMNYKNICIFTVYAVKIRLNDWNVWKKIYKVGHNGQRLSVWQLFMFFI